MITESYFDGLYHISPKKDLTLKNLLIVPIKNDVSHSWHGKPFGGLYLAKGLSWNRWATSNKYGKTMDEYLYRIRLNPGAKILQIKNGVDVPKRFLNGELSKEDKDFVPPNINYEKIAKEYDGVQAYYVKFSTLWGVPTVVVFNKKAIASIEPFGKVKDAISSSKFK